MEGSISDLLEKLQNISADDELGLEEWCNQLCEFYQTHERHSYSEITKYIISSDGGLDYMDRVIPILEEAKSKILEERPNVSKSIGKLIDHIQLEIVRIRYLNKMAREIAQQEYIQLYNTQIDHVGSLTETLKSSVGILTSTTEELKDEITKSEDTRKRLVEKIEKTKKEAESVANMAKKAAIKVKKAESHSITILGIFASITLAFIGGLTFSTSVLQNIGNASLYRIILVSSGIAAVIINVIYVLMRFVKEINKITDEPEVYPKYLRKLMIAIGCVIILDIVAWLFDLGHIAQLFQNWFYSI